MAAKLTLQDLTLKISQLNRINDNVILRFKVYQHNIVKFTARVDFADFLKLYTYHRDPYKLIQILENL